MKTFKDYVLNEIGDSRRPYAYSFYKWREHNTANMVKGHQVDGKQIHAFANFSAVHGLQYGIDISYSSIDGTVEVSFHTRTDGTAAVEKGLENAFRVLATVTAATKEFIKEIKVKFGYDAKYLAFTAGSVDKHGDELDAKAHQRMKLYMAFIKKEVKGSSMHVVNHSQEGITVMVSLT